MHIFYVVPLSANLTRSNSTTSSVSATWVYPEGVVDEFDVECSNGIVLYENVFVVEMFTASCQDLTNPGDNYTMTVTSISNDQENSDEIILTACKK